MDYYNVFKTLGTILYWAYGNGEDNLEKARQGMMTKAYFLAKDKKRISQYLFEIKEDINRKQS